MLQKSNDNFPYSMVFKKSNSEEVIGHSRLCKVLNDEEACFLESGKTIYVFILAREIFTLLVIV